MFICPLIGNKGHATNLILLTTITLNSLNNTVGETRSNKFLQLVQSSCLPCAKRLAYLFLQKPTTHIINIQMTRHDMLVKVANQSNSDASAKSYNATQEVYSRNTQTFLMMTKLGWN